jgi:hypothetical protein
LPAGLNHSWILPDTKMSALETQADIGEKSEPGDFSKSSFILIRLYELV